SASPFQLDLFREDEEIDAFLSAAANQAALCAQPSIIPVGVSHSTCSSGRSQLPVPGRQSFFDQSPLPERCQPQTASSVVTHTGAPRVGRGILPPSPLLFKAPQQIEAELCYTDVSLGVFSPSLTAAREAMQRQQLSAQPS